MSIIGKAQALQKLLPNVQWKMDNDDLSTLEILDNSNLPIPSETEVSEKIIEIKNTMEQASNEAKAKLAALGLSIEDFKALLNQHNLEQLCRDSPIIN